MTTNLSTPPIVPRQSRPTFLFVCLDGPNGPHLRQHHLQGHLSHVEAHWQDYVTAGPLKSPGDPRIIGSAFIVMGETIDNAWAIMEGDPYVNSGLYASITVHDMTMSIGLYPGGKIWENHAAIAHRANGGK